ncbi:GLPGLI family protein [Bizionia sp. KMM 8389]
MIKIKILLAISIIWFSTNTWAQDKNAVITYVAEINQKYVDSFLIALEGDKDVEMSIKQQVAEMYRSAQPQDFVLNIKGSESYYYLKPSLEMEEGYNIGSLADKSPYYTNISIGKIIQSTSTMGFISREPLKWEVTNKTIKIGGYVCYQAIATERLYSRKGFYYNRQVIAWFAPELPLNFGPSNYSGLPGLVLEIQRDMFTLTATSIILNPEKEVKIIRPEENSKILTEEESHNIIGDLEAERKKGN